jgi:hypothetical protein
MPVLEAHELGRAMPLIVNGSSSRHSASSAGALALVRVFDAASRRRASLETA